MCFRHRHTSNLPVQSSSATGDLVLLLPFGHPPHHSTPDHNYAFEECPGASVDADGIKHSFDKSLQQLNTTTVPTEAAINFLGDPGTATDLPDVNPRSDSRVSILQWMK